MGHKEMDWTAIDREYERQGEADDAFRARLAEQTKVHAAAIRTNIQTGHAQTIESITEGLCDRLGRSGVTEKIVRASLIGGPLTAGQLLLDLINKCIEADADNAALVELDREERAGGLDLAAIRRAAPELRVPS
jgi:hypothetical protein